MPAGAAPGPAPEGVGSPAAQREAAQWRKLPATAPETAGQKQR